MRLTARRQPPKSWNLKASQRTCRGKSSANRNTAPASESPVYTCAMSRPPGPSADPSLPRHIPAFRERRARPAPVPEESRPKPSVSSAFKQPRSRAGRCAVRSIIKCTAFGDHVEQLCLPWPPVGCAGGKDPQASIVACCCGKGTGDCERQEEGACRRRGRVDEREGRCENWNSGCFCGAICVLSGGRDTSAFLACSKSQQWRICILELAEHAERACSISSRPIPAVVLPPHLIAWARLFSTNGAAQTFLSFCGIF